MKTSFKIIGLLVFTALIATSCSRKKDKFINRNFHAMATKYNVLYNGYLALDKGRASVDDAFTDNYWELLPVERMQVSEDVMLPGQAKNSDFQRAEEKAIKAVQTHGMNIQGKEKNPQIDEAYLLLGKARYFDQRFVPSLEAFNYILFKYPSSDKINEAKVWREKTNMRLENNELAIKNLKRLIEQEQLEPQILADANAAMAQAYVNIEAKDSALVQLAIAAKTTKKHHEKARFNYIIGQLYNEFGKKDSANMAFDAVIEMHRKIPRAYYINAHLAKAANFDLETGNKLEFTEYLADLEEDRENRPFLDKIYHRIAEYHKSNSADSLAIAYYNKSLRAQSADKQLKSINYGTLGDMSFDRAEYRKAGAYYDSTMTNLTINTKPYRVIKKKRENLDDVIFYEGIAQANDSILNLVSLSDEDRLAVFTAYVDKLKKEAEELKEREEAAKRNETGLITGDKNNFAMSDAGIRKAGAGASREESIAGGGSRRNPGGGRSFYFYNQTTVSFGKNEFIKIWGNRSLKDNWRLSDTRTATSGTVETDIVAGASEEERFDPQFYVSKIPTDQKAIDSLAKERNFAYYQLGMIYKEKFHEYELSKDKFKKLLSNQPEERLILPSQYNLYRLYVLLNEHDEAEIAKNNIIAGFPDSRYAEILRNPQSGLEKDENSPESLYEKTYRLFAQQQYQETVAECETYIFEFEGEPIVPKFEILKASARGRLYGFEAYKEGVNYTALTYPNSPEGKKAEEIIREAFPLLAKKEFVDDATPKNFNVIYPFTTNEKEEIPEFVARLNEEVAKVRYFDLSTSVDFYDAKTTFVVVHGLKSIEGAKGFAEILEQIRDKKDKRKPINRPFFSVSSPNYEIVQMHKNLNEYLEAQ